MAETFVAIRGVWGTCIYANHTDAQNHVDGRDGGLCNWVTYPEDYHACYRDFGKPGGHQSIWYSAAALERYFKEKAGG